MEARKDGGVEGPDPPPFAEKSGSGGSWEAEAVDGVTGSIASVSHRVVRGRHFLAKFLVVLADFRAEAFFFLAEARLALGAHATVFRTHAAVLGLVLTVSFVFHVVAPLARSFDRDCSNLDALEPSLPGDPAFLRANELTAPALASLGLESLGAREVLVLPVSLSSHAIDWKNTRVGTGLSSY